MKKKFFTFVSAIALLMVSCGPINTDTPPVGNEDKEEQEEGVEEEEQQPDNVIYYTTSDGKKLFPKTDASLYGAFLVSNTYEDGQGVLTFDDTITSIGECAFEDCTSLTNITIPDSVTSIGSGAFYSCTSLTSITIPDSVTSIETWAFMSCDSLTSVYCKATTPPASGPGMFGGNASDRKIYVPSESVDAYKSAENWSIYAKAIVGYDF